jgi:microcystin-dependent protein
MAEPFVAEIRIFGFNFNPRGWAFCNGATIPISQNTALFTLLGTQYGGNGTTTFQLPNLAGRAAMFWGQGPGLSNRVIGETGGTQTVTLLLNQMPSHSHTINAKATGGQPSPTGNVWGTSNAAKVAANFYAPVGGATVAMNATTLTPQGGNQPHENMMPYLGINFCIALQGIFPQRP